MNDAPALTRTVSAQDLLSLVKPRLSALVLGTAVGGMWMGRNGAKLVPSAIAVLGIAGVIGAGNALNCYLERDSDAFMARTKNRPLPTGRMDPQVALSFGLGLAGLSLVTLLLAVNALTAGLATLALLSYVAAYTPLKSRSPWAMWVGCLPGALPPLMGWTAVRGRIEVPGLVLFAILFLWQVPHFLAIALYRKTEYRAAGLTSIPIAYGDAAARLQAAGSALLLWPITLLIHPPGASGFFYLGVANTLGALFCALAVRGWLRAEGTRWARQLFFASLLYLPFLFIAMSLSGGLA